MSSSIALETLSHVTLGARAIIYTLGAILGFIWRDAYNSAWSREKLAKYLTTRYPWFKPTIGLAAE